MKYLVFIILVFSLDSMACKTKDLSPDKKFIASNAIPFELLMSDTMEIMHRDMKKINALQSHELVFLESMKAHHEGALNMASSILIYTKNSDLKNFAISIIATQQNEIAYMDALIDNLKKLKK